MKELLHQMHPLLCRQLGGDRPRHQTSFHCGGGFLQLRPRVLPILGSGLQDRRYRDGPPRLFELRWSSASRRAGIQH